MNDFHFFAANVYEWLVTKPDQRDLPDLILHMEKQGVPYTLWQVPGKWDALYSIEWYEPQVEGAQLLGSFRPKKERDAKRKERDKKITQFVWGTV
jgi:hypothetical protein